MAFSFGDFHQLGWCHLTILDELRETEAVVGQIFVECH